MFAIAIHRTVARKARLDLLVHQERMVIKDKQVALVQMDSLEPISQCHRIWRRNVVFARLGHPVRLVHQVDLDLEVPKGQMERLAILVKMVELELQVDLVQLALLVAMENQVLKDHQEKMALLVAKDQTVMLVLQVQLVPMEAKVTMERVQRKDRMGHQDHQGHQVTMVPTDNLEMMDLLALLDHLAKMLNIVLALLVEEDPKWKQMNAFGYLSNLELYFQFKFLKIHSI